MKIYKTVLEKIEVIIKIKDVIPNMLKRELCQRFDSVTLDE